MLPWSAELAGRIDEHVITSELLRGNPLDDPYERPLWVYVPPGYDEDPAQRYATVYVIQGYTGHLAMWRNRSPYRQPFPETADAVFASGQAPGAIVVFVDAWTRYGGSQFVDSPGTGQYHSYLCDEVVPWVDAHYRTQPEAAHRAITGKSSGGFGAMITPILRPPLVRAAPAGLRRRHLALVGRLQLPGLLHQGGRSRPADAAGRVGLLLRHPGRPGGAAVRTADRPAPAGRVAALAGLGPGPDGAAVRGSAPRAARRLDRRRDPRRVVPRSGGDVVPGRPGRGRGAGRGDPLRAVRGHPHEHRLPLSAVAGLAGHAHRGLATGGRAGGPGNGPPNR